MINHKNLLGGRPTEKIKLSVHGFLHFCMMAKTPEGRKVRQYFIDIDKAYRQHLERTFQASLTTTTVSIETYNDLLNQLSSLKEEIAYLRTKQELTIGAPIPNRVDFTHDLDTLWEVSGIKDRNYLINTLKQNFTECLHFEVIRPTGSPRAVKFTKFYMTQSVYNCLFAALRSQKGVDVDTLPEYLVISVEEYYKHFGKKNTRLGNSR